jgi:PIN domain nuclease of toxin-antitoxin system
LRALLDTHIFLWWINDDSQLSQRCREIISDGASEVLFSVVSAWEIAVKARLGRLTLPGPTEPYIRDQISRNRFEILPIDLAHALRVSSSAGSSQGPIRPNAGSAGGSREPHDSDG